MFIEFNEKNAPERLSVSGVPFAVRRENGVIAKITPPVAVGGRFSALFFLGMSTESWQCSEWWGQQETLYDQSTRLFLGDRLARIRVLFTDRTEELISVIFGVNCFNYNLYFKPKEREGNLMSFSAPYNEPFASDPSAKALLEQSLYMSENTEESAEKASKWVFAYKPRADKEIERIEWFKEDGKRGDIVISAVTGASEEADCPRVLKYTNQDFFLRREYYAPLDRLSRRLYQYADELPQADELLRIDGFDAPDIRFYNAHGLDRFTNVYRANIMDMAYAKVDDAGMTHTSSANTANFGCYIGFGTYCRDDSYGAHVWTRDIGRTLIEVINAGYLSRARAAVEKLHEFLYYPSVRFKLPHWKRVANLIAKDENDLFNEGLENDGHASIMTAIYALYERGGVDRAWLIENEKHLRDAADCYIWQYEHPKESNFDRVFYSESETSTQTYGGYDLYSNVISVTALRLYARLFSEIGESEYAGRLNTLADTVKAGIFDRFTLCHPRFGNVLTDTTDDCWTYEYKRFAPALLLSDYKTYDIYKDDPELFDLMNRTFQAQKEVYYDPFSARQMGYGQGYLTGAALALDRYEEYTDCVNAACDVCYHHSDEKYIVPEGVIVHGSHRFWFRNCDLGNAVQQAETVKCARLIVGADSYGSSGISLTPRLPATYTRIEARGIKTPFGELAFIYGRGEGWYCVTDGKSRYFFEPLGDTLPVSIRFGPFESSDIKVKENLRLNGTEQINGLYYAYTTPEK